MGGSICEELGWWMRKNMITAHWIRVRHSQRISKSIIALKKPNWRTSEMSPWLKIPVIKPRLDSWGPHDGRRTPQSCSLPSSRHTFKWKDLESRTTITQNHNHAGEPENRQASLELPATILPPKFLGWKVRTTTPGLYLFLIKEALNTHCNPSSLIFKLEARKSSLYRQMLRRAGKLCMTGWWQESTGANSVWHVGGCIRQVSGTCCALPSISFLWHCTANVSEFFSESFTLQ